MGAVPRALQSGHRTWHHHLLCLEPPPTPAAIDAYSVRARLGGVTVAPGPLAWSSGAAGRAVVSFPASAFHGKPAGSYTLTAAAIYADGPGPECDPGLELAVM